MLYYEYNHNKYILLITLTGYVCLRCYKLIVVFRCYMPVLSDVDHDIYDSYYIMIKNTGIINDCMIFYNGSWWMIMHYVYYYKVMNDL